MNKPRTRKLRRGYTLTEVVILIFILAILSALVSVVVCAIHFIHKYW